MRLLFLPTHAILYFTFETINPQERHTTKERTAWIDFARAMAILAVVLCHASEPFYTIEVDFINTLSLKSRLFGFSAFTVGRLGVPIFLMISGYLLLDREYDSDKTLRFWKNNCLHLFICTELWLIIYAVFAQLMGTCNYSFSEILEVMLFIRNVSTPHLWYLPMILGVYLLIPFVANGIKKVNPRLLLFPLLIFSAYVFALPTLNVAESVFDGNSKPLTFFTEFSGGAYGLFLLMGYTIKKGCLKKFKTVYIALFCGIAFIATVVFQLTAYNHWCRYNVWYDNLFLFLCSVSLFELASRVKISKTPKPISTLSYYSFPIFLIHKIVHTLLLPYFLAMDMHYPPKVILLFACVTAITLPLVMLISKTPKIGNYILYLK